ncbi:leucine-rich repeat domain-containing protein [Capnocytophaga sp.]|uniref:leucine-rich repeat domain-containing protein n=1 Tax=Capnocytophaga sp. TaxID=44737 RepID=UPI0026DC3B43|nr:leucine-rich repeat domain-containing protein [Capnocytophaga sp.]MDO5104986.1 leucine-rich repeat domain-containing protein [Capnocytophaga sp.]
MKKIFMYVTLLTFAVTVSCNKKDNQPEPMPPAELNEFSLKETEIYLEKGKSVLVEITSGNGEYVPNLSSEAQKRVQIIVSEDKKAFQITGIAEGDVSTTVTDVKSKKTIRIVIYVSKQKPYEIYFGELQRWNLKELKHIDMQSNTELSKITDLGVGVFSGMQNLESIVLPKGLKKISSGAFNNVKIKSIILPEGLQTLEANAFEACQHLESVIIPNSLTKISVNAFLACGLKTVLIPNSIAVIENQAFNSCKELTSVTVGTGIKSIGNYAFFGCEKINSFTVEATTPPVITDNTFESNNTNITFYVPKTSVAAYKQANVWKKYASRIVAKH